MSAPSLDPEPRITANSGIQSQHLIRAAQRPKRWISCLAVPAAHRRRRSPRFPGRACSGLRPSVGYRRRRGSRPRPCCWAEARRLISRVPWAGGHRRPNPDGGAIRPRSRRRDPERTGHQHLRSQRARHVALLRSAQSRQGGSMYASG